MRMRQPAMSTSGSPPRAGRYRVIPGRAPLSVMKSSGFWRPPVAVHCPDWILYFSALAKMGQRLFFVAGRGTDVIVRPCVRGDYD
jgi:hypothetical protein